MLKNKVCVCVDGLNTDALVDTGATVSVMSVLFKNRLGHKVIFACDRKTPFGRIAGETLRPVGVCSTIVSVGGQDFPTEFIVLEHTTDDIILVINFLVKFGALLDCGAGEISL